MAVTVNGVEIPDESVAREVERLKDDYERYVAKNGGEADEKQLKEWALENLIEKELLIQEAVRTQDEPDEVKVSSYLEENSGVFEEDLSDDDKRQLCVKDLKIRSLVKSVRKNVQPPTEDEIRKEYDENQERFTVGESLKLSHICRVPQPGVEKSQVYMDLLALKKKIDDFDVHWVEAVQESDTYREDFGMFDTIMRGMLPLEVEEKLFALDRGQISDVIELHTGTIHLFKILVKRDPEVLPFDDVREDLASMMFSDAAENALNELIDKLKKDADITR